MSYIPDNPGVISTGNSTTAPLAALGAFTGSFEDVSGFSITSLSLGAGAPSNCSGSLILEFSQDGSTTDRQVIIPVEDISSPSPGIHTVVPIAKYFRARFDNGTTPQTQFRLQTIHHKYLSKLFYLRNLFPRHCPKNRNQKSFDQFQNWRRNFFRSNALNQKQQPQKPQKQLHNFVPNTTFRRSRRNKKLQLCGFGKSCSVWHSILDSSGFLKLSSLL